MKVFVAENKEQGYTSEIDYHWCDDNDLLMFGQFQQEDKEGDVSMCGLKNRKFTTNITVKDLKINKDFYRELICDSVEKFMNCEIDNNGNYSVTIGFKHKFNIDDIINELLEKASKFDVDQPLICRGRTLININK